MHQYDKLFVEEYHFDKTDIQRGFVVSKMRNKLLTGEYNPNDNTIRAYRMWYNQNKVDAEVSSTGITIDFYKEGCFGKFINFKGVQSNLHRSNKPSNVKQKLEPIENNIPFFWV